MSQEGRKARSPRGNVCRLDRDIDYVVRQAL